MRPRTIDASEVDRALADAGVGPGRAVGVCLRPGVGVGLAVDDQLFACATSEPVAALAPLLTERRPRVVWWSAHDDGGDDLAAAGVHVATAWDVAAVHRLLAGGWRADPARVWAWLHGLSVHDIPSLGQLDLLAAAPDAGGDPDHPVGADAHLRPEWTAGRWYRSAEDLARWAATAVRASALQMQRLGQVDVAGDPMATARCESTAELLCAEMAVDGLPIDVEVAERIIADAVGPRPRTSAEADEARRARDAAVLALLPHSSGIDLRSPADVKALLRRAGIDVPDTRAWRLETMRETHPVVDALLTWRKAERIATTFGYGWLDQHVRDGRLRGTWSASDGAAGRMTAGSGLHNLPAELRPAVRAEPGHRFVCADLGQIEPRVLAAVSGDRALAQATRADDLYRPVADRLGVERAIAKVAVLAAMYGQTSGTAGRALQGLERAYPVAMGHLRRAEQDGKDGRDVFTYGGRRVRMGGRDDEGDIDAQRAAMAARGRYARNASIQGAAAEVFKAWAVTVRHRLAGSDAAIVLCLHDELVIHARDDDADRVAGIVDACLEESTRRWFGDAVRFVTDTAVVECWADS
jgi:DNA polymerase-1